MGKSRQLGGLFFTFPSSQPGDWKLPSDRWHWDGNPGNHLDELNGVFVFLVFSELKPRGGGTLLLTGSHRLIGDFFQKLTPEQRLGRQKPLKNRFVRSHPYLTELAEGETTDATMPDRIARYMRQETDIAGTSGDLLRNSPRCRVVEVTGQPGDVFLCHPSIFHAPSPNHAVFPRVMRIKALNKKHIHRATFW